MKRLLSLLLPFLLVSVKDYGRPRLYINKGSNNYVLNISQKEGEYDLKKLVFTSDVEGFWSFGKEKSKIKK